MDEMRRDEHTRGREIAPLLNCAMRLRKLAAYFGEVELG
jgi:hypothetical protein